MHGILQVARKTLAQAAAPAATDKPSTAGAYHQWYQPAGKGESFYTGDDGYQYVDNMRVDDVRAQVQDSPFYLYSQRRITSNYMAYKKALEGIDSIIGYAVKANNNVVIMKHLQQLGSGAVLVSGNELKAAMAAGFNPTRCALCVCVRGIKHIGDCVACTSTASAARKQAPRIRKPDIDSRRTGFTQIVY